jgi:branched-chain amino acid transport system substrate-binding protein
MKAKLALLLLALAVAAVAIAALTGSFRKSRLRVGVLLPFSGPNAAYGLGMRNSIRLAVEEANARGGVEGHKIELVELDDGSDRKKAEEGAKALIGDPKMLAAIVNYDDETGQTTRPIFMGELPTVIAGLIDRSPVENGGPGELRFLPDGFTLEQPLANYAWNTLGLRRFVWGSDETPFGIQMMRMLRQGLSALEHKKEFGVAYRIERGATDFKKQLDWAFEHNAEYVQFGGEPREAALFLKALRAAGYKGAFEAGLHSLSQEFIDLAGPDAEGTLHVFPSLPADSFPAGKTYLEAYAAHRFPEPPTEFGILAYAETQALISAISQSLLTRASVAGALHHEALVTSLGAVRADYVASSYHSIAVYRVEHGRWVPIYTATDKDRPPADG